MTRKNSTNLRRFTTKFNEYLLSLLFSKRLTHLWAAITKPLASKVGRAILIVSFFCGVSIWTSEDSISSVKNLASNLFGNAESIAIGSAAVVFFLEIPDRKKRDQYEAWQLINSGLNQTGSGGRVQALEDLKRDGVDLEGVAAPKADLSRINLSGGKLSRANFMLAQLDYSDLSNANLSNANLSFADLSCADLSNANLSFANLSNADLSGADLSGADLSCADLSSPKSLTEEQLSKALLCGTELPRGVELDPNRDCNRLF